MTGYSTVITDYVGVGLAASRPATPNIATGAGSVWFSSDSGALSVWNGSAWAGIVGAAVTSIVAGSGLAGGTITATGTVSLAAIAAGDFLANTGTASAVPVATALGTITAGTGLSGGPFTAASGGTLAVSAATTAALGGITLPAAGVVYSTGTSLAPVTLGTNLSLSAGTIVTAGMAAQASNSVTITGGTITGMPQASAQTDVLTKEDFDNATCKAAVLMATTTALAANTYNNGSSGVGATLTANANGAIASIDAKPVILGSTILVKNEATAANNGLYVVTALGDASNPYVLTRSVWMDTPAKAQAVLVSVGGTGTTNKMTLWFFSQSATVTFGSTSFTFVEVATGANVSGHVYSNGTTFSRATISTGLLDTTGTLTVKPATTAALGGVIIGAGMTVDVNGTISTAGGGGSGTVTSIVAGVGLVSNTITTAGTLAVAAATTAALGGVIVGSGLVVSSGTLSTSGGGAGTDAFARAIIGANACFGMEGLS